MTRNVLKTILKTSKVKEQLYMKRSPNKYKMNNDKLLRKVHSLFQIYQMKTFHQMKLNQIQLQCKRYLGLIQGHTNVQILNGIRNGEGLMQCFVFPGIEK